MEKQKKVAQPQDKYVLRLPDGMRDHLKDAAASNNRSLNAEIVARLEDFANLRDMLGKVTSERSRLADDKERLEWELDHLEAVKRRFFDKEGKPKPVLAIPQPLLDRIRLAAEQNHRTLDAEAQAALETAFPPKSIDVNVLSAFLTSLVGVSAPDGDKEYLRYINNALAEAEQPWTVQAGWVGEVKFYPYASPSVESPEDAEDEEPSE